MKIRESSLTWWHRIIRERTRWISSTPTCLAGPEGALTSRRLMSTRWMPAHSRIISAVMIKNNFWCLSKVIYRAIKWIAVSWLCKYKNIKWLFNQKRAKMAPYRLWRGVWNEEKDGSCSTSFSHRPEWWDSADRYKVERDGTLHLTRGEGDLDESLRLTHLRREALENGKNYFVSKKTLILRKVKYERSK